MSSLMAALGIVGGVVLAGVVAHGAWTARPPRVHVARADDPSEGAEPGASASGDRIEPSLDDLPVMPKRARSSGQLDALVDAISPLSLDHVVSGDMVLAHLPASRRAGTKPFLVEGLNERSGQWEPPVPGETYRELQAGVLLANRNGALNEIEFSEFVQKIQAFADAIGASTDFPDMLSEVSRARELDLFASAHDAQLAIHLKARGAAWTRGYIQQHAARHGFVQGVGPGRLVLPGREDGAPPVLSLQFDPALTYTEDPNAAVRDITLSFDVAQTSALEEPFKAWQASSLALALGMDAAVVDDNGHPLTPEGFAAIERELAQLYAQLAERDMAAGSSVARRVFA